MNTTVNSVKYTGVRLWIIFLSSLPSLITAHCISECSENINFHVVFTFLHSHGCAEQTLEVLTPYVTQFLVQRTSGMHRALWDTFGSIIHCLKIMWRNQFLHKFCVSIELYLVFTRSPFWAQSMYNLMEICLWLIHLYQYPRLPQNFLLQSMFCLWSESLTPPWNALDHSRHHSKIYQHLKFC